MSLGHLTQDTVGLITLVGLITISASTYMILYSHPLYERLAPYLSLFERKVPHREQDSPVESEGKVDILLVGLGRFGTAVAEHLHQRGCRLLAVDFDPDHDRAHATLGWALLLQGRLQEGLTCLERAVALSPDTDMWRAQLGQALALHGREDEARSILRRFQDRPADDPASPYHLAYIHTGLGEHDQAMDLLERAFEDRVGSVYSIKASFLFAPLRSHPRFRTLMEKMDLG